ncbi:MAG: NAD(P)-dependent alcohol dehydrogenase [Chloroflexi bacterium]|nr:NAD(P)-dependent alcohol dehydrogenase [Chloroflexota bacterium]
MLAARLVEAGKPLEVSEVPTPEVVEDQVLVKIAGAGVCHSDLHILDMAAGLALPLILGHENTGYVARLGPEATGLDLDEPVAVYGGWGCGTCDICRRGEEQLCDISKWVGLGSAGGYAEFLLVPHSRYLVPLAGLDPVESAPLVDAALTPYRAIKSAKRRLDVKSTAVALGVGGLGQFAIQLLSAMTEARIIAVDVDGERLERAVSCGADETVKSGPETADTIRDLTNGEGAQVVFDLVGSDATLALATQMVAKGGRIALIGLAGGTLPYSALGVPWEVEVTSSAWGTRDELAEVLELAREGRIRSRVQTYPLQKINEALSDLRAGNVEGRAVVTPHA